jgi:hypothetical protein
MNHVELSVQIRSNEVEAKAIIYVSHQKPLEHNLYGNFGLLNLDLGYKELYSLFSLCQKADKQYNDMVFLRHLVKRHG